MKEIKAIIFDFDGTLIRSEDIKIEIFVKLFEKIYKIKKDVKKYYISLIGRATIEQKIRLSVKKFLNKEPKLNEINDFKKMFSELYRKNLSTCPIISCMHLMNYVKHNTKYLFIVSLQEKKDINLVLEHCGLKKYFTAIYGAPKLKKENITSILIKYKLEPKEIIYIGDEKTDILVSKKFNIKSIGVNKRLNKRKILHEIGAIEAYKDVCSIPFSKIIPNNNRC
jgi:phosphoglycolate phosphatase